jgi:hypothetical protein
VIARTVIPELVPRTYNIGKAEDAKRRKFQFSVTGLVEGDTLEDVWENMKNEERISVVAELSSAIYKLHSVRISNFHAQEILQTMLNRRDQILKKLQQPGVFGGPSTGFVDDGTDLLNAITERRKLKKSFCSITMPDNSENIRLASNYEDLAPVILEKARCCTVVA